MVRDRRPVGRADADPPVQGSHDPTELPVLPVHLDQRREIRHRHPERSTGRQDATPLAQYLQDFDAIEVLQHVTRVDQADGIISVLRKRADVVPVVDVRKIVQIDVDEAGDVPAPAPEVELG